MKYRFLPTSGNQKKLSTKAVDKDVENMFGGELTASLHKDIFSKSNICTVKYIQKNNRLVILPEEFPFKKFIA